MTEAVANIKVLAVDDNPVNLKVVSQYLTTQGYEVISAASGEEAVEVFQKESPNIVLMDIMMPGMNGHEATARIKELSANRWTPVIFMSALSREEDKVKGLDVGGDDYITKPIEFTVLGAKLKAMQRIADMQNKLAETTIELERYRDEAEQEQTTAYELMDRLFNAGSLKDKGVHAWHIPATRFSGDLIIAEQESTHRVFVLHADSTGHGLAAALPLMPISQIFYEMVRGGYAINRIVQKMNAQLKEYMPVNRFVALTMLMMDRRSKVLEVWNGGNPPVLVLDGQGEVVRHFDSKHLALGILPDQSFDQHTEYANIDDDCAVVLYSDGLLEAENKQGEAFGEQRLYAAFKFGTQPEQLRDNIISAVSNHLGEAKAHDDMSLVVLGVNNS